MRARVAWIWPPIAFYPKRFWLEEKRDSLQYTIEEVAKEHDVLLLAPVSGKSHLVDEKYLYADAKEALHALIRFNPDIINLNLFASNFNEATATSFPKSFITLSDYGGDLFCSYAKHVAVFFTTGKSRKKIIVSKNGVPPERVVLNPYGADTRRFYPDDSVEKTYTGIMVGDFRRRKQQHLIIKIWVDVEGKLLLVGRTRPPLGDVDYVKECRALIGRLGLSERVEIQDFVLNDELPRIINSAEIGIRASKGGAGGRAATETMACGLPLIVLKNKLNEELVKSGGIKEVELGSMAAAVNHLKNNPDEYRELSEAALRAIKSYTYDGMLAIYRKVIDEASATR